MRRRIDKHVNTQGTDKMATLSHASSASSSKHNAKKIRLKKVQVRKSQTDLIQDDSRLDSTEKEFSKLLDETQTKRETKTRVGYWEDIPDKQFEGELQDPLSGIQLEQNEVHKLQTDLNQGGLPWISTRAEFDATQTKTKTQVGYWEEKLDEIFEGKLQVPSVKQDSLKDAWDIFGTALMNKVSLRSSTQMRRGDDILLPQFDPNFHSPNEIRCRMAGCKEKKQRSSSTKKVKEDLWLCPTHQARMSQHVGKLCEKQKVSVKFGSVPGDFENYTSLLIPLMERAYYCSVTNAPGGPEFLKSCPKVMQDVFLNIRNFLFITNAVLNPDEANLGIVLPPVMTILMEMMNNIRSQEFVTNLASLLRDVMEIILFTFGVFYTWVSQTLGNPGGLISSREGGVAGAIAGGVAFGTAGALIGYVGGYLFGGLIGGGIYNAQDHSGRQRQADEGHRRYAEFMRAPAGPQNFANDSQSVAGDSGTIDVLYHFTGNLLGDLALYIPEALD